MKGRRTTVRMKIPNRLIAIPFRTSLRVARRVTKHLERTRITAAINQQILARNITGMYGTKKRTIGTKLSGIAVALGRTGLRAFTKDLLEGLAGAGEHAANVPMLGVAVENAGQQIVDGHVAGGSLPREPARETHQPRTGSVRQAKLGLRDFHAARHDI